jgi:hypothetical protein
MQRPLFPAMCLALRSIDTHATIRYLFTVSETRLLECSRAELDLSVRNSGITVPYLHTLAEKFG